MNIENYLSHRYPGEGKVLTVRNAIAGACNNFVKSGLADNKFINELCSGSNPKFWACLSEALLAEYLFNAGIKPTSLGDNGPDFLVIDNGKKIWIEVTCPEPKGLPTEWTTPELGTVWDFPHKEILLRWTSSIKEKAEKLLGTHDGKKKGYISKEIVAPEDAYIIAINGRQLRNGQFSELCGISQFPFAAEAVFSIGPYQIKLDKKTLEKTSADYQHRPLIQKSKGMPVPAYTFLDPRYKPISAIWAVDVDGTSSIGNLEPLTVIHNPNATNPIPTGFIPARDEYVATPINNEVFQLNKQNGLLINEAK